MVFVFFVGFVVCRFGFLDRFKMELICWIEKGEWNYLCIDNGLGFSEGFVMILLVRK